MNLPRSWETFFAARGVDAVHWSRVGDVRAPDAAIMTWAREHERIVFTNDLDFGTALALTKATGPSVLQVRTLALRPEDIGALVIGVLEQCSDALALGALLVVDAKRLRIRMLPLRFGG